MPKKIMALLATIIFFDRLLKALAVSGLFSEPTRLIGDLFKLSFTKNFAIAFSLPARGRLLEAAIFLIILVLVFCLAKLFLAKDYPAVACLAFILIGAASNFFDRIKYGYVIDYLDLKYFTVFNLADAMIVAGTVGIVYLMVNKKYEKLS